MVKSAPSSVAYSYIRFSHPSQAEGNSLQRQTEAAAEWCKRNGIRLDSSTTLHDLGKSAYTGEHRKNPDRHALAAFLKLVEARRVPKGSYLIIENLDRLSREHERAALRLWMDLLDAGINIVQLHPETVFRHEQSDMFDIMRAVMELSRGHGESAMKSKRNGAAWVAKRRAAREGAAQPPRKKDGRVTKALTARVPAWVAERDGKLVLIPEKAAAVRRIFDLAVGGYGMKATIRELEKTDIKPLVPFHTYRGERKPSNWNRTYVAQILNDRRAVGELQPRLHDGTPDGPPIPNYYPAAVTEDKWHAARAAATSRKNKGGRPGKNVNLFSGLLKDAREVDGSIVYVTPGGKQPRALVNLSAVDGRAKGHSFPVAAFEDSVLAALREVSPRDILPPENGGVDQVLVLSGKLTENEGRTAAIEAELMKGGEVAALSRVLRHLEAEHKTLVEQLAEAKQKQASPLGEAWSEFRSLAEAVAAAPDQEDARVRLRGALRRVIEGVWCLFTGQGAVRVAAAEVWFTGGHRRCYLIFHEPPRGRRGHPTRPGRTWWLALDGPWNKSTERANSLRDRKTALRVLGKLTTFDIPPYEDVVDAAGHAGLRAALTINPAALLTMLEYMDPEQLPEEWAGKIRLLATACVQLGWPVFPESAFPSA
jgi:DNA invertase Pin-like site-specific DNA recombinase